MQTFRLGRQGGMALIMALIFLLILVMLGVATMQNTLLQERMAGNFAEHNQAFQLAELAVRTVERMQRDAVARGDVLPPSHTVDDWPAQCPDIFDDEQRYVLGCSGAGVSANDDCLASLSWQAIAVAAGAAEFVIVPLDHVECATPADETLNSNNAHGAFDASDTGGPSMVLVLGRGRGPANTSEAVLQTLYFGGAIAGRNPDSED
jgi:Tfp pilus assembly protein PilX